MTNFSCTIKVPETAATKRKGGIERISRRRVSTLTTKSKQKEVANK